MSSLQPQHCIAHYDEIALKGKNRSKFEGLAMNHMRRLLNPYGLDHIKKPRGRFILQFKSNPNWPEILKGMEKVFGITHFSPVYKTLPTLEALKESLAISLKNTSFKSFGIETKRPNKKIPLSSQSIKVEIGAFINQATQAKVNLTNPECWVEIEIDEEAAYYSFERFEGPRGLPIPASGKMMCLLSGGIDSPVAAYQIMRRGCELSFVHFHSSPFTNQASIEKVRKLVETLLPYQGKIHLYLVPFAALQQKIVAYAPASLRVILYRRAMVRIAEKLAQQEKAQALITGDNLGQVASQTIQNIACIDKASTIPILRPLISFDKLHIIQIAKNIHTYPISILPDEDCCHFMLPDQPATKASLIALEKAEGDFPLQEEMDKCLQQSSLEIFDSVQAKSLNK